MFRIKICGITNAADALMAAAAGADAIGLNFYAKSRRGIDLHAAAPIVAALPAGVTKVGVFVNHAAAAIRDHATRLNLDAVQLHGDEPPEFLHHMPANVMVVRALRCGAEGLSTAADYLAACQRHGRMPDAVLIDADAGAEYGGTGNLANWSLIERDRDALAGLPLILAGGLLPHNVATAIAAVRPNAVDVASGVESAPGRKDAALTSGFVAAAAAAFSDAGR